MYVETKLQVKIYSFCFLTMHFIVAVIVTICVLISTMAKERVLKIIGNKISK